MPAYTWKIVVVLANGENDLNRISASTRVIAVKMPNIETVNSQPWEYYRVSVDELDAHSGYDFLSALPTSLQVVLEAKADDQPI